MIDTDRRERLREHPNRRIALIWFGLCAILITIGFEGIVEGRFPDPDDNLRLVQVRDWLAGQSWFDLRQYRIDPPQGASMHWSRIVDLPLAFLIVLLAPIFGPGVAETIAAVIVPLLLLGAILFFVGRLAWRLFGAEVAGFACLIVGLMAPVLMQISPMRIDHHGWQIMLVAAALWAIAHRSPYVGGGVAGAAMAVGLTVSIELLPMTAAFGAVLALRWFREHDARWWLVSYMQALALGLTALFLATRGWSDTAQYCDAISPAHLGFFLICAVLTGGLAAARNIPGMVLIAILGGIAALGLVFFALSAPGCIAAPFAQLDPLVHRYWYVEVLEGQPVWSQDPATVFPGLLQLTIALGVTIVLLAQSNLWLKRWWREYALLLAVAILGAIVVWRSAAFACIIAAIPLGWMITRLLHVLRNGNAAAIRAGSLAIIAIALLPGIWAPLLPGAAAPITPPDLALDGEPPCDIDEAAAALDTLPTGTIMASLDIGPTILRETSHAVVATGHHRADAAIRDVIATFIGTPEQARTILQRRGVAYVALCTDLVELVNYREGREDSLAARLDANDPPDWLHPVRLEAVSTFRVYRVTPE